MSFFKHASLVVIVLVLALVPACTPECGPVTSTRCDGVEAQICNADLRWATFARCDELGPGWVCADVPGGAACLPGAELDGGALDSGAL